MENDVARTGLEKVVIELLESPAKSGVNQTNILLLLSLVNIMGIVDIIKRSPVDDGVNIELQRGELSEATNGMNANADLLNLVQQAAAGNLDPVQLLGMLNKGGGQMPNYAALMALLSQMMPPPPPEKKQPPPERKQPPPSPGHQPSRENTKPSDTGEKDYKRDFKQDNQEQRNEELNQPSASNKGYLKWDPRLG